jgi:hypothetical protein
VGLDLTFLLLLAQFSPLDPFQLNFNYVSGDTLYLSPELSKLWLCKVIGQHITSGKMLQVYVLGVEAGTAVRSSPGL